MISTDPQVLQQLMAIIDFVQNISTYKDVVAKLQDATTKYNDAYVTLSKGQNLTTWEATLKSKQDAFAKQMSDAEDSFKLQMDTKERQLADRISTLADKEATLLQMEQDIVARNKQSLANEAAAAAKVAEATRASDVVKNAMLDIKQREQQLADKTAKLKTLIG